MACTIVGDSIAVGVGHYRGDCALHAKSGISTRGWLDKWGGLEVADGLVIISLGSNDSARGEQELEALIKVREKFLTKAVIWILPAIKPRIRELIKGIALDYGDQVLEMHHLSPDHVHPRSEGYRELARSF